MINMKTILYLSPLQNLKIHMLTNLLLMLMKLWEGLINILELLILEWYGYTLI
ncbi:153L [Invertebrate iridescent virus Kaz2018]|nr:153L [Invertebrate iridescent virus Kaz2018]